MMMNKDLSMDREKTKYVILFIFLIASVFFYFIYNFYMSSIEDVMKIKNESGEQVVVVNESNFDVNNLVSGGIFKDGIPSVDDPKFESVRIADQYLDDDGHGLLVQSGKHARFYPYQILVWHEIVNDVFKGQSLLVTYCPLCNSGIVFERNVNESNLEFGVSGKLYNSNLIMYDRSTNSLWSQVLGESVHGELVGSKLTKYPSLTISWNDFKKNFPNGDVLSRKTGASRDYTRDPYSNYYTNNSVFFPLKNKDSRLHVKDLVVGFLDEKESKVYSQNNFEQDTVINDTVGGQDIVVFWDSALKTVRGFSRNIKGDILDFRAENKVLVDNQTNTRWDFDGEAFSGELRGSKLTSVALENYFWFCFSAFNSNINIHNK